MFCNSCNNNNDTTLASLVDSSTVATSGCYTGFIPVSVNYNVVPGNFVSGTNFTNTNNNLASANPFSALDNTTQVYNRSSSCCRRSCCRCCRCCCR
ncbi:hypothetical protein [Solibaculum mannosilyticum]|uniref:Uncharacterized protein n=1 Tax=Solibaculum mannosilyticum TaxID=2780922 RepID=A0A7I8D7G0_9FIRM|nr:hypothetical protein [Solibaculum mannosilyticum]BCI60564.1 hypothetical protein C12CBH8_12030 [Solibaculum mannosilyticum]